MGGELEGWKEIGKHFDKDKRTVQDWEKRYGLPVYRPVGATKKRVYADRDELDAWWKTRQGNSRTAGVGTRRRGAPMHKPFWALATMVCLGILTLWTIGNQPGQPTKAEILNGTISILDRNRKTCFVIRSPGLHLDGYIKSIENIGWPLDPPFKDRNLILWDLERDGTVEVLFNEISRKSEESGHRLICYEHDGKIRWEFKYGRELMVHGRSFTEDYGADFVLPVLDGRAVLAVAHNDPFFVTQVALLNSNNGELIDEYWHPGRFNALRLFDIDGDGSRELLLAGVNNPGEGNGHPALAALKLPFDKPKSDRGAPNYFGPGNAKEFAYLLFPRFDLFEATKTVSQAGLDATGDRLQIAIGRDGSLFGFYDFRRDLSLIDFRPTDLLIQVHQELFLKGVLKHEYAGEERSRWMSVLRFQTAPDGNSPDLEAMFYR